MVGGGFVASPAVGVEAVGPCGADIVLLFGVEDVYCGAAVADGVLVDFVLDVYYFSECPFSGIDCEGTHAVWIRWDCAVSIALVSGLAMTAGGGSEFGVNLAEAFDGREVGPLRQG